MSNITIGDKIKLPRLSIGKTKSSIGFFNYCIFNSKEFIIKNIGEIQISPRTKEKIITLDNDEIFIITEKTKVDRPSSVTGVLRQQNTKLSWISHRELDKVQDYIARKGFEKLKEKIISSWTNNFSFKQEVKDSNGNILRKGLRPPQIGGLYSIGSHWSVSSKAASIIMPTGTGKTETMLATLPAFSKNTILIIVPWKILRNQTYLKFLTFGLLRELENLVGDALNPIVGVIQKRPKQPEDLKIFDHCNVVISTMSSLSNSSTKHLLPLISQKVDTLIIDEAHHIGAQTWTALKEVFSSNKILQFTATPFRRDGMLVDGKVIFEYSLGAAQRDGYFKPINFSPIYEIDPLEEDIAIAQAAVAQLKEDIVKYNHVIMARCENISRAESIHTIYKNIAPEFKPVIIHSGQSNSKELLDSVLQGESKIVVCVNMLGEGFDFPNLKIAALHDIHKSLAILLQFAGRFTRTSSSGEIGDATVIANIADPQVSNALERLYSEDSDWNKLLSEFSSDAAKSHKELIDFLEASEEITDVQDGIELSNNLLRPGFSTLFFSAENFNPKKFHRALPGHMKVVGLWEHSPSNTMYFVTEENPRLRWTRSSTLKDKTWHLHVISYDEINKLIYFSSSHKKINALKIAQEIGATSQISGEKMFRVLGKINRLIFQNVGVTKQGRRNLRFAMYTGSDVVTALSITEKSNSVKSNLSATGWEDGKPVSIGCSIKGRVWNREYGSIPELTKWCHQMGTKILDESISTENIIENVLLPTEIDSLPQTPILGIDWPIELLRQLESSIVFKKNGLEIPYLLADINFEKIDLTSNEIHFSLSNEEGSFVKLKLKLGVPNGYEIIRISTEDVKILVGKLEVPIEEYLTDYPPLVRFIDLSELDGNLHIKPQNPSKLILPENIFSFWDWSGIDIEKESMWKNGQERKNSIQWKTFNEYKNQNFDIIFNDDASGEAADLICLKEHEDYIQLVLIHCKFSGESTPGKRISDIVEVSSQSTKSAKWKWRFKDLCSHIKMREKKLTNVGGTRFLVGSASQVNNFVRLSKFKEIKPDVIIVQPGFLIDDYSEDQSMIIAAATTYLKETIGVDLKVIGNKKG